MRDVRASEVPADATRRGIERAPRALSGRALAAVAVVLVVLRAIPHLAPFIGPWPLEPGDPVDFAFRFVAYVLWGTATLLALSRRSTVRLGWLLVAITATDAIWALQFIPVPALYFITDTFVGLSSVMLAHILVSFPTGTLVERFDRRFVAALYGYFLLVGTARLVTNEPGFVCAADEYCPVNPFAILANRDVVRVIDLISPVIVPLIGLLVIVAVIRHWRAAGQVGRRILRPLVVAVPLNLAYNVAWYAAQSYDLPALREFIGLPFVNATSWILPAGFLLGIVRARAARVALPAAVVGLGRLPTTTQLESLLRSRLGDPTLRLVRWSQTLHGYVDSDGLPVDEALAAGSVRLIEIQRDGEPAAGVVLDATLDDPGLEATIGALIGLTLEAADLRDELRAHGGDVAGLPTGEVTFLFGDIEGSTLLLEALGERYGDLLREFRAMAFAVAAARGGRVVDARADEVFMVFGSADDAAGAAVDLQRRVGGGRWPDGAAVRVRIGLHTGTPTLTSTGYVGVDVHRAARVMAAAHGGQVLASSAVVAARHGPDPALVTVGSYALRGLSGATELYEAQGPGLGGPFPPIRAEPATGG
jgi:class 3 adenylate cyclase